MMNGVKYYVSMALLVIFNLLNAIFIITLIVSVYEEDAGGLIGSLFFLLPLSLVTKRCYSYHKKIDYKKTPSAKPVVAEFEDDKNEEPIWMAERKGIDVQPVAENGGKPMKDQHFKITLSGDSGSDYDAVVEIKNSKLFIQCGCPAGQNQTRCKHALSLLERDFSRVKDSSERKIMSGFFNSFKMFPKDAPLISEMEAIEKQEKALKEKKKSLKKQMDRLFFEGIPVE